MKRLVQEIASWLLAPWVAILLALYEAIGLLRDTLGCRGSGSA